LASNNLQRDRGKAHHSEISVPHRTKVDPLGQLGSKPVCKPELDQVHSTTSTSWTNRPDSVAPARGRIQIRSSCVDDGTLRHRRNIAPRLSDIRAHTAGAQMAFWFYTFRFHCRESNLVSEMTRLRSGSFEILITVAPPPAQNWLEQGP